jgi:predicted nucleic acid-binding protein
MLVLDTTVYIDRLQGKISAELRQFLEEGAYEHSSIAFQEMMVSIGTLSPNDPRTQNTVERFCAIAASVNPARIHVPDVQVCIEGALLAGTLARIQGYDKEHRFRAVNDCTLFLQSQKLGTTLLTRNYADFDILLQMIPSGRVVFY